MSCYRLPSESEIRNAKPSVIFLRMIRAIIFDCVLIALLLFAAGPAIGQQKPPPHVLRVGTTSAPPFAMKLRDGKWTGISIELWRELAAELGLEFRLEERKFTDLLAGLEDGSLDVGVTAITVTAERESVHGFHPPLFHYRARDRRPVRRRALALAARGGTFPHPAFSLRGRRADTRLLVAAGFLVWIFERRRNPEHFNGELPEGIGEGVWWAIVTMTTVGYGDKSPKSLGGRVVATAWMFVSIIILSSFTAAITSSLTISQLGGSVKGLADLNHLRVGSIDGSTGAAFLTDHDIEAVRFVNVSAALQALAHRGIDAYVGDAAILRYMVNKQYRGRLQVLPQTFEQQYYGIALPSGSALREPLNRSLLLYIRSEDWKEKLRQYLGP